MQTIGIEQAVYFPFNGGAEQPDIVMIGVTHGFPVRKPGQRTIDGEPETDTAYTGTLDLLSKSIKPDNINRCPGTQNKRQLLKPIDPAGLNS